MASSAANLLAALAGEMDGHTDLDLDHRNAVRQGIMQLPGDTQAFLHGPPGRRFVPGPFRFLGALLDLVEMQLPHAEGDERDNRGDEPARRVDPASSHDRCASFELRGWPPTRIVPGTHPDYFPWQYRRRRGAG